MTTETKSVIAAAVERAVRIRGSRNTEAIGEMRSDQNLLEFVDSFGFLNLILDVEKALDLVLDLSEADLSRLVHFEDLVEFLWRQSEPRAELA